MIRNVVFICLHDYLQTGVVDWLVGWWYSTPSTGLRRGETPQTLNRSKSLNRGRTKNSELAREACM